MICFSICLDQIYIVRETTLRMTAHAPLLDDLNWKKASTLYLQIQNILTCRIYTIEIEKGSVDIERRCIQFK